jgi:hypothetical protein
MPEFSTCATDQPGMTLMDKKYYHFPPLPSRPQCPVCKKAVYSRGGVHPQCAMIQADPLRVKKPVPSALSDPSSPK